MNDEETAKAILDDAAAADAKLQQALIDAFNQWRSDNDEVKKALAAFQPARG
jgi:hypothetical protein